MKPQNYSPTKTIWNLVNYKGHWRAIASSMVQVVLREMKEIENRGGRNVLKCL